jgi:hypothetical protein
MSRANHPVARYAIELGFTLTPGSKHWHASHPGGGRTIIPFGRKISPRSEQNIRASLRRAARGLGLRDSD